jgi:hypothetical protein
MLDFKPQIVHFTGHGAGKDGLAFEDGTGQPKLVDSDALANLFKLFSSRVECVVLNACYSEVQAEAIAQHIDYVIGMSQTIGDRAAIEFAVGFYTALGAGESIEFAYELGCNSIQLAGIPEFMIPTLLKKKQTQNYLLANRKEFRKNNTDDNLEVVDAYALYQFNERVEFWKAWLKVPFWKTVFNSREEQIRQLSYFPLLDIKLRNTSPQSIFLKELTVQANLIEYIPHDCNFAQFSPTCAYHVLLSRNWHNGMEEKAVKISQVIKSNYVDRIIIIVGCLDEVRYADYKAKIILHYNKESSIEIGDFLFRMGNTPSPNPKKLERVIRLANFS